MASPTTRAVALIDPYWLIGRAMEPTPVIVHSLQKAIGGDVQLERIYWYIDSDASSLSFQKLPRVSIRVVAQDDLDDGYELVRAMDGDLRGAESSNRLDAIIIASHDDRLALSIERIQAKGMKVIGCSTTIEDRDPRIQRIVDEIAELRIINTARPDHDPPPSDESVAVLEASIAQWKAEVDVEELERTRLYIEKRPGLPRPVDSRLLFLGRTKLGRELTQGERVLLRRRFREINRTIEPTATAFL